MTRSLSLSLRVVALVSLCLVLVASSQEATPSNSDASPLDKRERGFADDHVRIAFCTSCGFKQNFMEVKTYLEDKYPHLVDRVDGVNFEVDPMKALLARALGYAQLVAMVFMVFGESIFSALGWDMVLLQKALDNRIGCFAVILLMGSVSQGLVSSGAFEVFYNDSLVFSKLEAGRWPTLDELSAILEAKGLDAIY